MHDAQDQQHQANFGAERFQRLLRVSRRDAEPQRERDKSDIDQVEPDDEQVVDRIRERRVPVEAVHQEHAPIPMQGARHPGGERDADAEVSELGPNDECHRWLFLFN